jgi:hypothetical protein
MSLNFFFLLFVIFSIFSLFLSIFFSCTADHLSSVCVQCMTSATGNNLGNEDYFLDFNADNLSKEEKEKRLFQQSYMQQIIYHLLTTATI